MIREKINAAIQDMPENEEIKQLLSGSCKIPSGGSSGITKTNAYQSKINPVVGTIQSPICYKISSQQLIKCCLCELHNSVFFLVWYPKNEACLPPCPLYESSQMLTLFMCNIIDRHSLLPLPADCGDPEGN